MDELRINGHLVSQIIEWRGEENCEEVFQFLGLEHPEDGLDHSAIHHEGMTALPGDSFVRDTATGTVTVRPRRTFFRKEEL